METELEKTPEQIAAEKAAADAAKAKAEEGKQPLSQAGVDFLNKSIGKVKKEEDDPEKKKAAATKKTETEPEPKPKPKPAAQKKTVAPPKKTMDADEIAELAAATAAKTIEKGREEKEKAEKKEKETTTADPLAEDPDAQEVIGKLKLLEKQMPDKYKGIEGRYRKSVDAWSRYASDWERKHPNEEFDENAEEHRTKREELEGAWAYRENDHTEALINERADERADKKVKAALDPINSRLEEFDREKRLRDAENNITQLATGATGHFLKKLGKDFKEIVKDGALDAEKFKAWADSDPISHEELSVAMDVAKRDAGVLYRIFNELETYDPEKNEDHRRMYRFNAQLEQEMMERSDEERRDAKGRLFVPVAEYVQMDEKRRAKHWIFDYNDLAYIRASRLARAAVKRIKEKEENFAKIAKARKLNYTPRAITATEEQAEEHDETTENDDGKPETPTAGGTTRTAAAKAGTGGGPKSNMDTFLGRGLGKTS